MRVSRETILALESQVRGLEDCDVGGNEICRIEHRFAPGVYAREMWMPEDSMVIGKIHMTEHLNILSQGKVTVSSGDESFTISAPYSFVSGIGTKRAIYAHEDSTWTTIHATQLTDPEAIESEIIAESFEELDCFLEREELKRIS